MHLHISSSFRGFIVSIQWFTDLEEGGFGSYDEI